MSTYALIVPLYRSAENIPDLIEALTKLSVSLDGDLEVVAVDDGSPDGAGNLMLTQHCSFPLKVVFHSRNFGSFTAIRTGLEHTDSTYSAVIAADLQEPPELILEFYQALLNDEADVVFGHRLERSDPLVTRITSKFFWAIYRRFVLPDIPPGGVDIFGANRKVIDAVLSIEEPNSSLVAQLFWVGFRRKLVPYKRRARQKGKSAWNMARRFRYMMDSIFSYSDFPILMVLWLGIFGCTASLLFACATIIARLLGYIEEPGYTSLAVLIVLFGSLSLFVQGVLGSYLWRALENSKHRPMRIVSHIRNNME